MERVEEHGVLHCCQRFSMIKLYMINGPMAGLTFDLEDDVTTIGRSSDNSIGIQDLSISRKHTRITLSGDRYFIEDLNSRNGTWINGHPMNPGYQIELKEGDFISVGNISMSVGEPYSEDGMITHYSIGLLEEPGQGRKDILYRDTRITDRDKLEMMYEVCTVLMQSLDLDQLAEKLLESVFSCLKSIDSGALILIGQETGEHTRVVARSRDGEKGFKMNYSRTIVNRVVSQCRAVMMSDTSLMDRVDLSTSMIRIKIKSVMCVPLVSKAEIYGVIYVHSLRIAQGFTKEDLFFLTALSSPAALAVENALLFSKHTQDEQELQKAREELEHRVEDRTKELSRANVQLKQEIAERKQAEENLETTHAQLKEANKNLELAYAQLRDAKDRISSQLQGEEIAFLTDEDGRILGFNDKAAEVAGQSRLKLVNRNIRDLLDLESGERLKKHMKKTRVGVFHQTSILFTEKERRPKLFRARMMPVNMEKGKMLLFLMRMPD
jgi:PAS domain S-box-containing protein